ncbi:hypothetical protein HD553DRAFT_353467 [Filobasidium floriforme]|nr:uncharacterized protein HD553DRAFT_353467 [Filobasidium floriforme]KAH8077059.1 hypothetical protein HD553DRAFT_353467 [Filobasidium floriforme]
MFGSDYYSNTISWRYNNNNNNNNNYNNDDNDNDNNICSVEDIVYGEWLDDKPLRSLEEVTERYQLAPEWNNACSPISSTNGTSHDLSDTTVRTIKVASPYLVPRRKEKGRSYNGARRSSSSREPLRQDELGTQEDEDEEEGFRRCTMLKPDRRGLIKRLLRSRNGLVLIGDSITEHQGQVLITMFGRDITDGLLEATSSGMWENGLHLVPSHPEIPSLLAEAGVTEDRLRTPLIKFWRHHHLATDLEKVSAFAFAGDRYSLNPERETGKDWYEPMIEQATRTEVFIRPDSEALEEPTMIVLNLGAHLVWYELGKDLTPLDYLEGMENIVNMMEEKLRNAPIPLSPVIRTMAPGHVGCATAWQPDNYQTGFRSEADIRANAHNYNTFSSFNGIMWKARSSSRAPGAFDFMADPELDSAGRNPGFRVMDVWPMSAKRADAHLAPGNDCLHWCRVGVQNYWADLMFHMMLDESRNHDYM